MFHKLCTLALALVVPINLATALILQIPRNPTSGGQFNLPWINEPNDPATWDLGLVNGDLGQVITLANNVDPSPASLTLTFPVVPVGSGYTIWAFVENDFNRHFATSSSFSINPATSSADIGSSTDSSATSSSTTSSSTDSSSTTSLSTTSSVAGYSIIPQPSFTANNTTATPSSSTITSSASSSSTPSAGLSSGEIAGLASSIPIGVIGLILTAIGIWYARKQAQAGRPFLGALKDDMIRFRHAT